MGALVDRGRGVEVADRPITHQGEKIDRHHDPEADLVRGQGLDREADHGAARNQSDQYIASMPSID